MVRVAILEGKLPFLYEFYFWRRYREVYRVRVYESAEIDGATSLASVSWRITLPIIKEPLAISTILNLIGIVSCFNTIWLMTKGGPLYSTEIIYTFAYRKAFIDHNFGTAAAASVVLFVFMAVFSGVYLKMVSENE